jgi:O-antigen/teichoic acid export membrane protein
MFAARDLSGFRRLIFKLIAIGFAVLALGPPLAAMFGRTILTLLYRPEYGDSLAAFVIMVAAGGVSAIASFLGYGMTAARCFRAQVPLTAICTLTTALATYLLVPHYGLVGAALGLLASAIVLAGGCTVVLHTAIGKAQKTHSLHEPGEIRLPESRETPRVRV